MGVKFFVRFASSLSEGAFWHCASTNYKPALKGEVDASETSRRRGCIEVVLVYANPSVNPTYGVLPAPRKGEPFGIALPKSFPRVRGKWHEVPKGVRLRGGCKCNEQPEVLHRGCSCLRQPLSQLRCQLPVRGAFWVPSPRMHAPDIPQIIAYMLKLTSISCFSIVTPIYIDNLMIIGYLITIRRGLCMKEINSFG